MRSRVRLPVLPAPAAPRAGAVVEGALLQGPLPVGPYAGRKPERPGYRPSLGRYRSCTVEPAPPNPSSATEKEPVMRKIFGVLASATLSLALAGPAAPQ